MTPKGAVWVSSLLRRSSKNITNAKITAVGTNSAATAAMLKAGADYAATGENAVVVGCRKADVIVGPIGIVIADALFGEITPRGDGEGRGAKYGPKNSGSDQSLR